MFIIYKMFHTSPSEKSNKMACTEWFHFVQKIVYIYIDERTEGFMCICISKRPEGFIQTVINT